MEIKILQAPDITARLQEQLTPLYHQLNDQLRQLSLSEIMEKAPQMDIVVAIENEELVGIAMMAKYKVISGHKGMIEDVVVSKDHRGKGIGRKLMEKLLEKAETENLDDVLLFSGHHRTAAITLYKSLGFQLKESGLYIKKYS